MTSDHDSTFHVTETPALTTWPSVTYLAPDRDNTFHVTETYLKLKLLCIVSHKYIVYISVYSDVPFIKQV